MKQEKINFQSKFSNVFFQHSNERNESVRDSGWKIALKSGKVKVRDSGVPDTVQIYKGSSVTDSAGGTEEKVRNNKSLRKRVFQIVGFNCKLYSDTLRVYLTNFFPIL